MNELNNAYFTIEKSRDGINFEILGTKNGAGNSDQILNYEMIDYRPYTGTTYYRLKQTDVNGKSEYAGSIVAVIYTLNDEAISVYPNPAHEQININWNTELEESLIIKNSDGKVVYTLESSNILQTIDISYFETGIYIIEIENKYRSRQIKFVKI